MQSIYLIFSPVLSKILNLTSWSIACNFPRTNFLCEFHSGRITIFLIPNLHQYIQQAGFHSQYWSPILYDNRQWVGHGSNLVWQLIHAPPSPNLILLPEEQRIRKEHWGCGIPTYFLDFSMNQPFESIHILSSDILVLIKIPFSFFHSLKQNSMSYIKPRSILLSVRTTLAEKNDNFETSCDRWL